MGKVRGLGIGLSLVVVAASIVVTAWGAEARMTIRSGARLDELNFHAQYWGEPFDPADDFALMIWTCPDGGMPAYLAGFDPAVVCRDAAGASTAADLSYGIAIDGGTCVDHGQVCYVRAADSAVRNGGVRFFKVQYAKRGAGNKIWLETVGDLSDVTAGNMLLQILIDGRPHALLEGSLVPSGSRGLALEF